MIQLSRRVRLAAFGLSSAMLLTACAADDEGAEPRTSEEADVSATSSDAAAATGAADLRTALNTLLAEHVFFAGAAVNEALQGNTAGFESAAGALDENSVALSAAIGSVYGEEAGEAFLGLWRSHIGMFVDYTKATAAGDTTAQQKAVDDLTGYAHDFAVFLNGANPALPVDTVEGLVVEHVVSTKDAVDALASGDAVAGFTALRTAMGHMKMLADPLAQAIVAQFPDKFGGDPASPAADLRTTLNLLLAEHTQLAGAAVNGALKGNTAEFEAAAGALDGNSEDLAGAVGSVYGEEAGEAFLGLWRSHIGMFVDYTKATAAGDTTAQQKAVDDLTGYAHDFAVFLNGANDQLPVETVEGLVLEHVTSTKAAVDAVAAGEPDAFSTLREAGQHMSMIADPLAAAIAAQQGM